MNLDNQILSLAACIAEYRARLDMFEDSFRALELSEEYHRDKYEKLLAAVKSYKESPSDNLWKVAGLLS